MSEQQQAVGSPVELAAQQQPVDAGDCRYHFGKLSELSAERDWRALETAVAHWVLCHGGSKLLAKFAARACLADSHGDSAVDLGSSAAAGGGGRVSEHLVAALRKQALVGDGGENDGLVRPFVVDAAGRFYLRRNHVQEVQVAERLRQRISSAPFSHDADQREQWTDALFGDKRGESVQAQRRAVMSVPGKRLFVLTGGPGTGKTSTVLRMLLMLLRVRADSGLPSPDIRISAPTGKAAQRLSESLRLGREELISRGQASLATEWQAHIEHLQHVEATTLHRLLGARGRARGFSHHGGNPLNADIVVVDEASMMDLAMLHRLLDALRPEASLILVGDADQLTSVATGSVLLDLVAALTGDADGEMSNGVRLQHSFRADSTLLPLNEAVRLGQMDGLTSTQQQHPERLSMFNVDTPGKLQRRLEQWAQLLGEGLQAAGAFTPLHDDEGRAQAFQQLRRQQLLCALREGEFGALLANARIEQHLQQRFAGGQGDGVWYPGRAVIITVNDYNSGLYNGDIGLCLQDPDGHTLRVWFEISAPQGAQLRGMAPGSLPEHKGAFALTIHKSQGSEYQHVAVLLPPDAEQRILSRQLLYTAVSRARESVQLWSTRASLQRALDTPVQRVGGLRERLRG